MADNKGKVAYVNPFVQQGTRKELTPSQEADGETSLDGKKEDVFLTYEHLSRISGKIAKELNETAYVAADVSKMSYQDIMDNGLTFFMSTNTGLKRTGLLSLFPALLTGMRLYSEMFKRPDDMDDDEFENLIQIRTKLLSNIESGIEAVFKFIYRGEGQNDYNWREDENRKPVFDASPYESEAFYPEKSDDKSLGRSYIGSISWAVPLFLKIINLVENEKEDDKKFVFEGYRKEAKKLVKWCLDYVNSAVLTNKNESEEEFEEKGDKKKKLEYNRPVGWNFSKIKQYEDGDARAQRSLYFTYEAASIYVTFYEEYKDILDYLPVLNRACETGKCLLEKNENGVILLENDSHFRQAKAAIADYISTLGDTEVEFANELQEALAKLKSYYSSKPERYKRKLGDYYWFNKEKPVGFDGKGYSVKEINDKSLGPLSQLKWNLEKISADIWKEAKDILEDKFVYDDFLKFNEATPEAIQSGGQTNALFAGLLHINICLNSKYDFVVYYTKDKGTGMFGKKAFYEMQNTMLLHVQRTQRFFDKLSNNGKAFGVDSLILRFSENFDDDEDRETAERLRKQLIRIASLSPMLLKTNNLISQYVVQYPQKQMGEAIAKIGEKRFYDRKKPTEDENDKYSWFWDSDGYHAMSNYYYVKAIFDFYEYYEKYEKKYISRFEDFKKQVLESTEYTEEVQKHKEKINSQFESDKKKSDDALKIANDKIAELNGKLKEEEKKRGVGDQLVNDIIEAVKAAISNDPEFLKHIVNGFRAQLAKEVSERYSRYPENEEYLKKLEEPIEPKGDKLFPLLQALATDIILQSAISGTNDLGKVNDEFGDGNFNKKPLAYAALIGGEQLINGDIDKFFANLLNRSCVNFKIKGEN